MTIEDRITLCNYERSALAVTEEEADYETSLHLARYGFVVDEDLAAEQIRRAAANGS